MKRVSVFVGAVIGIITIIGALYSFECHYAKAEEVRLLSLRLDQKIEQDRYFVLQEKLWKIQDRYKTTNCETIPDNLIKETCRSIQIEMRQLDRKYKTK